MVPGNLGQPRGFLLIKHGSDCVRQVYVCVCFTTRKDFIILGDYSVGELEDNSKQKRLIKLLLE